MLPTNPMAAFGRIRSGGHESMKTNQLFHGYCAVSMSLFWLHSSLPALCQVEDKTEVMEPLQFTVLIHRLPGVLLKPA